MSYDLRFLRRLPGESWEEAFEADEEDPARAGGRPAAEVWSRMVARATELLGEVEVFDAAQHRELTHGPTGIQLLCWSDYAAISVPSSTSPWPTWRSARSNGRHRPSSS